MGGSAAVLMHLLTRRAQGRPHHLDGLLLVTPAGIHIQSPLYVTIGGNILDVTLAKIVNAFRFPDDRLTRVATKIVHDIRKNLPAMEALVSVAIVRLLGGNEEHPRSGPFSTVQQLTYNMLTCGTSTKVYVHLRQLIVTGKFQAFDYEPTARPRHFSSKRGGNLKAYGKETPPEYTSMYHLIDVPVHLIAGRGDRLIGPVNVLRHYDAMKSKGVDVTLEIFDGCGHVDFTCGLNTSALYGLLNSTHTLMDRILTRKTTL